MGLLARFVGRTSAPRDVTVDAVLVEGDGGRVDVVGESHYLDALLAITQRRAREEVRQPVIAALIREPDNPYDAHAIAVYVDGRKVGHLSREDASDYQGVLVELEKGRKALACHALVCAREGTPNLGVFLELLAPDDVREELRTR